MQTDYNNSLPHLPEPAKEPAIPPTPFVPECQNTECKLSKQCECERCKDGCMCTSRFCFDSCNERCCGARN